MNRIKENIIKYLEINTNEKMLNVIIDAAIETSKNNIEVAIGKKSSNSSDVIRRKLDENLNVDKIITTTIDKKNILYSKGLGLESGLDEFGKIHSNNKEFFGREIINKPYNRDDVIKKYIDTIGVEYALKKKYIFSENIKYPYLQVRKLKLDNDWGILKNNISVGLEKLIVDIKLEQRRGNSNLYQNLTDDEKLIMDFMPTYAIENCDLLIDILVEMRNRWSMCKKIIGESTHVLNPILYFFGLINDAKIIDLQHGFFNQNKKATKNTIYHDVLLGYPNDTFKEFIQYRYENTGKIYIREGVECLFSNGRRAHNSHRTYCIKMLSVGFLKILRSLYRDLISRIFRPRILCLLHEESKEIKESNDKIYKKCQGRGFYIKPHPMEAEELKNDKKLDIIKQGHKFYAPRIELNLYKWSHSVIISFSCHASYVPFLIKGDYNVVFSISNEMLEWLAINMNNNFNIFFNKLKKEGLLVDLDIFDRLSDDEIVSIGKKTKKFLQDEYSKRN